MNYSHMLARSRRTSVLPPEITITSQPANQTAISGAATFSVSATVTRNKTLSYQWQSATKTSSAGTAWVASAIPGETKWESVAFGPGGFFAVGSPRIFQAPAAARSADGVTWSAVQLPAPPAGYWISVQHAGGRLFVQSQTGQGDITRYLISDDGITFVERNYPVAAASWNVAYGGGTYVAMGYGGSSSALLLTSSDGETWQQQTFSIFGGVTRTAYGNGVFVLIGVNSTIIATSADGAAWTERFLPVGNQSLRHVAFGNGVFVAISVTGRTFSSSDGISWTRTGDLVGASGGWLRIAHGEGLFVAVGTEGGVVTSENGSSWLSVPLPRAAAWYDVAFGSESFVAIVRDELLVADGQDAAVSKTAYSLFADVSGATLPDLALTGLTAADDDSKYRVTVSADGASPVVSSPATLQIA